MVLHNLIDLTLVILLEKRYLINWVKHLMKAKERYDQLQGDRSSFLSAARRAADLTVPYLIRDDNEYTKNMEILVHTLAISRS